MKTTQIRSSIKNPLGNTQEQLSGVCAFLEWTPEQYCNHQLDQYEEFLKRMFWGYPVEMLNEVRYSSIMSGFWKNEWYHRNRIDFMPFAADMLETCMYVDKSGILFSADPAEEARATVMDEYLFIHSAVRLINDDAFMAQYNHALKLIRNENRKLINR